PRPARRVPMMIGSTGQRMLEATLASADAWNLWGPWRGNDPPGFARENARVSEIASTLGRAPAEIVRSVCVFTAIPLAPGEEPVDEGVEPLTGSMADIARRRDTVADEGVSRLDRVVGGGCEVHHLAVVGREYRRVVEHVPQPGMDRRGVQDERDVMLTAPLRRGRQRRVRDLAAREHDRRARTLQSVG